MTSSYHLFCDFSPFGYECQLQQARRMRVENLRLLHFLRWGFKRDSQWSDSGNVDLVPALCPAPYQAFSSCAGSITLPYNCLWLHESAYIINAWLVMITLAFVAWKAFPLFQRSFKSCCKWPFRKISSLTPQMGLGLLSICLRKRIPRVHVQSFAHSTLVKYLSDSLLSLFLSLAFIVQLGRDFVCLLL